jgi:hypothetical protein
MCLCPLSGTCFLPAMLLEGGASVLCNSDGWTCKRTALVAAVSGIMAGNNYNISCSTAESDCAKLLLQVMLRS